jgi:hypothetical protein
MFGWDLCMKGTVFMDEEIVKRIARLEKTVESEEKIRRFERLATRVGSVMILLMSLLLIFLNKLDDVVLTISRVLAHAFEH